MSDTASLKVTVIVGETRMEVAVIELRSDGAALDASETDDRQVLDSGTHVELLLPSNDEQQDRFDAVILAPGLAGADAAQSTVFQLELRALNSAKQEVWTRFLETNPGLTRARAASEKEVPSGQESRRSARGKIQALAEIPLEAYRQVLDSAVFADDQREKVLSALAESEKAFFRRSAGKGIVAELLALKMKMKHELDAFQEHFSSTASFLAVVKSIATSNRATLAEHVGRLDQEQLATNLVAAARQVQGELDALLQEQESTAATIAEVVGTGAAKQAEEDAKRKQDQLAQAAARQDGPASDKKDKDKDKKEKKAPARSALRTPASKVGAAVLAVSLFGATWGVLFYWSEIMTLTLSSDGAASAISGILPVVRSDMAREQLNVYIDESQVELDGKQLAAKVERAMAIAQQHSFKGLRVFDREGKPLFHTARSDAGLLLIQD